MSSPLLEQLLDIVHAECVRSPAATVDAVHLRAVLLDRLLADGHGVLEPSTEARVGRLLRLVDDVVRVERVPVPPRRTAGGGRPMRAADMRIWTPERLDLELYARGTFRAPATSGTRALHERLARLAAGASDALLLACDRRSYDALRRGPGLTADEVDPRTPSSDLAALAAAVLPPSSSLSPSFGEGESELGRGQRWTTLGAVTPMVFGVQRVVLVLRLRAAGRGTAAGAGAGAVPVQLDAFGSSGDG